MDDRVGHRQKVARRLVVVDPAATAWRGDRQGGDQHAARRVAHVVPQRHGVVDDAAVHTREAAPDVAVAQKRPPPLPELLPILLGRSVADVIDRHCSPFTPSDWAA